MTSGTSFAAPVSAGSLVADNAVLDWALFYLSLGWSVVPAHMLVSGFCTCKDGADCLSPGKHPAVAWKRYQSVRPDEQQLRQWFEGPFRSYNIGITTGTASGDLFVLDVDDKPGKPGGEHLRLLQEEHGRLPPTVQARTGGGGRHYLFTAPAGLDIKTDRDLLGPGLNTRGKGGFIVVAPSVHQSGNSYE